MPEDLADPVGVGLQRGVVGRVCRELPAGQHVAALQDAPLQRARNRCRRGKRQTRHAPLARGAETFPDGLLGPDGEDATRINRATFHVGHALALAVCRGELQDGHIVVAVGGVARVVGPREGIRGTHCTRAPQRAPVDGRDPAGRAVVLFVGDGVVAADVVLAWIRSHIVHHQMVDLAGHQRLLTGERAVGKDGAIPLGGRTRRELCRGQRRGRHVGCMGIRAVVGQQAKTDDAAVAPRIARSRLPVQPCRGQVAADGGPEAVGDDSLLAAVDADHGVAQGVLPEDAGAVEPADLGRVERVTFAAGLADNGLGLLDRNVRSARTPTATAASRQHCTCQKGAK